MLRILFLFFFFIQNFVFASFLEDAKIELKRDNIDNAIKLFKQSARVGNDEANFELGKIYYLKKYNKRDLNLSFDYFKKAADYGDQKSKFNLALIYAQKEFKKYSLKQSYELFNDLAKDGYPSAQYMVSMYLLKGYGVDKDYVLAKKWIEEAYFENGYEEASCIIASIYANGYGVLQNLGRARKFSIKYKDKYPLCRYIFNEFKLYKKKYSEDKGFKFGYYNEK